MKITKKVVFEVEYADLDDAITEFFKTKGVNYTFLNGRGYRSVAENDWINDSSYEFNVTGKLTNLERQIIKEGALNELGTKSILNWMCNLGRIELGEYLIRVCW